MSGIAAMRSDRDHMHATYGVSEYVASRVTPAYKMPNAPNIARAMLSSTMIKIYLTLRRSVKRYKNRCGYY